MKEVTDSGNLKVLYPSYTYFLDLLKAKKQFNYTRIQHGVSDVLIESYSDINELLKDIQSQDWLKISTQVVQANHGVLQFWHKTSNPILEKFAASYRIMYEGNSLIPNLHLGVSAGIGFGKNGHGSLLETNPMQQNRALVMQTLTQRVDKIYHGGIPRHMSVMGETFDFFDKLNQMEFDVVIYGPMYMKEYRNIFKINSFHHLPIAPTGAIGEIENIFPQLIEYCTKLKNPLILNCSGHIISQLLAYNLRNTSISNFDIGIGFNWNIREILRTKYPDVNNPWIRKNENFLKKCILNIRK
jgi:hypothetical protein